LYLPERIVLGEISHSECPHLLDASCLRIVGRRHFYFVLWVYCTTKYLI